jgi:hypothetical protein
MKKKKLADEKRNEKKGKKNKSYGFFFGSQMIGLD